MPKTSAGRYIWIDYAKFLSIFLVVYFHTAPELFGFAQTSLSLLRMPCFFFLAGLLFKFEKYPSFSIFFKHRFKQLIIPYFWFFLLFYTYWLVIGRETGNADDLAAPFYQPALEYLYGVPRLVCMPLWFIPCLLATQCVYFLAFRKMSRTMSTALLLLFPLIPVFLNLDNTPFSLRAVCNGIPFYGMASLYRNEIIQFVEKTNNLLIALGSLFVYLGISWCLTYFQFEYVDVYLKLVASFSCLLFLLVVVQLIASYLGKSTFVEHISANTIIILAFHTYSIIALQRIILFALSEQPSYFEGQYTLKFIIAALSLVSMLIPIHLITRYTPFVLGRSK